MKKILLISTLFLSLPGFASEITSPFYQPNMGQVLLKTSGVYSKSKLKNNATKRTYRRTLTEEIVLGLGSGFSALVNGNLNWTRQKQETTLSVPHTKDYATGILGQWALGGLLTQFSTLYNQTTEVNFKARRAIETHVRLGKELKTMTPYMHLQADFPLNARPEFNNPFYQIETGVFQKVSDKITLDTALYLSYDKNVKGKSYGFRGEWSYLATEWLSIGITGKCQMRGHAKSKGKTYNQEIGAKISFSF